MITLREDADPHRSIEIVIGQPEARAILSAWTGTTPTRPSTWDLFVSAVQSLQGTIATAVITAVEERRYFYAVIEIEHEGERRVLAARPSDAIALALRTPDAEIHVADSVMTALGMGPPGPQETN